MDGFGKREVMKVLHICYEYPPIGGGGGEA
jgi:hypothetical protein